MLLVFNNNNNNNIQDIKFKLETHINPTGDQESELNDWMMKNRGLNLYSSKMIKLQNSPGKTYELIKKINDNFIYYNLYYNGPPRSTSIPSFHMTCVKYSTHNMQNSSACWNIIIQNMNPLQKKDFVE